MSEADKLQAQHRVTKALTARLAAISRGEDLVHNHHMAGVEFSELGWHFYLRGSKGDFFSGVAVGKLLEALDLAEGLDEALILNDLGMARARLAVIRPGNKLIAFEAAIENLIGAQWILHGNSTPEAVHAQFINTAFMARVYAMRGLEGDFEQAHRLFVEAQIQARKIEFGDDGRAYRSMLLYASMFAWSQGSRGLARELASVALRSARFYNDRHHNIRARAIWLLGPTGERFLHRIRKDR